MAKKLKFFKAVLKEIPTDEVMDSVYPFKHDMKLEDRISNCSECGGNEWMILADEQAAVREGGKAYCECLGCGEMTHL